MTDSLATLFNKSKNFSSKWVKYFDVYEENFSKFKGKNITFVEIGVSNGGSLEIWKKYFGPNSKIIGIDINPECKKFEKDNVEIFIGNQSDQKFWRNFFNKVGMVDIILDDGGHTNLDQIISTVECVKNINDGGIFVVEDTHTSYNKKYNSSKKYNFINFSKKIIDDINSNIKMDLNINQKFSLKKYIYSTQFYESITIFNIDRKKSFINEQCLNHGINHKIEDLTWDTNNKVLKKYKEKLDIRFVKNFLKIIKKKKINNKLKKFFS
ncbi:class I SAM-dependent methyltransferase [Candidatus Pelagibacter sp.]|nr:class I SAM-dependent methyltransferase [Candidatus Pelagibacter sp.]